jgi:hypothetical protein
MADGLVIFLTRGGRIRCGRVVFMKSQNDCGSGTIHRLSHVTEAPRPLGASRGPRERAMVGVNDQWGASTMVVDHDFPFPGRRVSGSRIVDPFCVSLCAR